MGDSKGAAMRLLQDAFDYNGWATRQLGEVCRATPPERLAGKEEWQYDSILGLWRHIAQVERAYLGLIGIAELPELSDDLESLLASSERAAAAYRGFAGTLEPAAMER